MQNRATSCSCCRQSRLTSNRVPTAIFKSKDLEVLRLVLRAGDYLPPHRVPGGITVQCLHGALELGADGEKKRIQAGQMC